MDFGVVFVCEVKVWLGWEGKFVGMEEVKGGVDMVEKWIVGVLEMRVKVG